MESDPCDARHHQPYPEKEPHPQGLLAEEQTVTALPSSVPKWQPPMSPFKEVFIY
jgi:hypothetical protein